MSKKTLVVTYLPSGERSSTKQLVDAFLAAAKGKTAVEHLDLLREQPDVFSTESLGAYVTRNYMGQALAPAQAQAIAKMDRMTAQLKAADSVVVAFPMHNFGLPAAVKAWFDSVLLKGQTWDMNASGFVGLMKGKQALILCTSGGVYEGPMAGWEHAVSLAKVEFTFMGYDVIEAITAPGMNANPAQAPESIAAAVAQIHALGARWYA
jgi:FMN-dependent NADH-azoreductase